MKNAHDLVAQAKAQTHEIAVAQAENAIRNADVLIDVREADEYAAGHPCPARCTCRAACWNSR